MIDLNPHHLEAIRAILSKHVPECEVRAFGSRVNWAAKDYSDSDLAVVGSGKLSDDTLRHLKEAFEESDLPFRVDVLDLHAISPSFQKVIEKQYQVVQGAMGKSALGEHVMLRDILSLTRDGEWGSESPGEGLAPMRVIRGTDFESARLGESGAFPIRFIRSGIAERKALQAWDILIETAGGSPGRPTGRTALVQPRLLKHSDLPITCASFARFLRIDERRANSAYVYWYLQHLYASGEMEQHQVQHTGIARFQFTRFADSTPIPLPSPSQQHAIARILGTLDDKIELNRQMNETLEAIARALFKSWFVDFDPIRAKADGRDPGLPKPLADLFSDSFEQSELGEIPKGWKAEEIKERASHIQYGLTRSASKEPIGPRFLRITDIQGGRIDWSKVPYCEVTDDEGQKYKIQTGDIFVARTGASTGENVYVIGAPGAVFASYLVRFQFHDPSTARFVGEYMRTPPYFEYVKGTLGGSAQPNASAQVLAGDLVGFPPIAIAKQFAEFVRPLDQMRARNEGESCTLAALRDALLPKLISGELRVVDGTGIVGKTA